MTPCPRCGGRISAFANYVETFDCRYHFPVFDERLKPQLEGFKSGPIPMSEFRDGRWRAMPAKSNRKPA